MTEIHDRNRRPGDHPRRNYGSIHCIPGGGATRRNDNSIGGLDGGFRRNWFVGGVVGHIECWVSPLKAT